MPYGTIKIDTVTFTDAGVDKSVTLSGLVQNPTFSGSVTVTGTLSGVTVTGTTANFTSGNFTNISGGTHTITSGVFAAGSAASPSITFTGDTNTGIYSPGADQVAISTGGSGRLFVDASGKVGLGGTPNYNLDLYAGSVNFQGANQGIYWDNATNKCAILGDTGALKFSTGTSSVTERLRITSAGLVGVGTSSPQASAKLHVYATGNYTDESAPFTVGDSTAGGMRLFFGINNTNQYGYLGSVQSATAYRALVLQPGGGNVGVGTTAPNSPLDVVGSSRSIQFGSATRKLYASSDTGGVSLLTGDSQTGTGLYFDEANHTLRFATGSTYTERLRIDSSGRVGIGTSSPGAKLDIASLGNASSVPAAIFRGDAGTGNSGGLALYNSSVDVNERNWYIVSNSTVYGDFVIKQGTSQGSDPTSGTNRFYINPSGNVGIGTTSPSANLHIGNGTASADIILDKSESGGAALRFWKTGALSAYIQCDGSEDLVYSSGSANHVFYSGGVIERARIDSSGRLLVGTSSQSGGALLQVNGDRVRIATAKTPASATDTGTAGEICWDASYVYVCTATNTWKRSALSTW